MKNKKYFTLKTSHYFVAGMNIFVAFFVLLLLLADSTPPAASAIPLIGLHAQLYLYANLELNT